MTVICTKQIEYIKINKIIRHTGNLLENWGEWREHGPCQKKENNRTRRNLTNPFQSNSELRKEKCKKKTIFNVQDVVTQLHYLTSNKNIQQGVQDPKIGVSRQWNKPKCAPCKSRDISYLPPSPPIQFYQNFEKLSKAFKSQRAKASG